MKPQETFIEGMNLIVMPLYWNSIFSQGTFVYLDRSHLQHEGLYAYSQSYTEESTLFFFKKSLIWIISSDFDEGSKHFFLIKWTCAFSAPLWTLPYQIFLLPDFFDLRVSLLFQE